jgi:hypothetical protein
MGGLSGTSLSRKHSDSGSCPESLVIRDPQQSLVGHACDKHQNPESKIDRELYVFVETNRYIDCIIGDYCDQVY